MTRQPVICFLTGTLDALAGAERVTAVVASELAARGYTVHVLALWGDRSAFPLHAGVQLHALHATRPSFKTHYLQTVLGIRRYLKRHGIDVLIGVDTMLALFTWPASLGMSVRQIAWEHCNFDEDLGRRSRRLARRIAANRFEAVVVLTESDRARWQQALSPHAAVVAMPNPLPFAPQAASTNDSRLVLAVGRLVQAKGFDVLLHAWHRIAAQHPQWRLRIVGEGEERVALEALRTRLGLDDSVDMPGATPDIVRHYRDAAVFCLSSRYEGFGMVLIEAMACGLPIVSTDCRTGPREILSGTGAAVLVPVDDADALAAALNAVIRDPEKRAALRMCGAEIAERYRSATVVDAWIALVNGKAGQSPA